MVLRYFRNLLTGLPVNDAALAKRISEIEPMLLEQIPREVAKAQFSEPAYALILCYIDSTTDEYTPYVVVALDKSRQLALERKPDEASSIIWSPHQQRIKDVGRVPEVRFKDASLRRKCQTACMYLFQDYRDDYERLLPFREMMYRVAQQLNRLDWSGKLPITDDFVVIASDWSGRYVRKDAPASLPAERRELLESRQLFFNGPAEQRIAERLKRIEELRARIEPFSVEEQVRYWIAQLHSLFAGEPCEVRDLGCDKNLVINSLQEIGPSAVLPLLDFLETHADAERGDRDSLRISVIWLVRDIGLKTPEVHRRLRLLFENACRLNEGNEKWQLSPFHYANCLHDLFTGYPKTAMGSNHVPDYYEKILAAPMPT